MTDKKIVVEGTLLERLAELNRPIVFTNGCFDILHRGHVDYLNRAKELGQSLIVGVNTDASVRRLEKGSGRPINCLEDRMAVLAALAVVDLVVSFEQDTPLELITKIEPDYLVKGGDWAPENIVGAEVVQKAGGEVRSIPIIYQQSTTNLINRIRIQNEVESH